MFRALEQSETERQQPGSLPVSEEAEVADADEAAWQQVQKKAAEELVDRQAHDTLLVAMSGVTPAEADLVIRQGDQSAVGDADAVSVCAEIAQGMFRSAERPLGVDDPVVMEQDSEPGGEATWLGERCELTMELELAFSERSPQAGDELAAEDTSEHLDWKKEETARRDPTGVIWCEPAGSDHAVDMGMVLQPLIPGVEHAKEADLSSKVSVIACDLEQRGGTGAEQQAIDQPLVL